jgi:hypothetical protein
MSKLRSQVYLAVSAFVISAVFGFVVDSAFALNKKECSPGLANPCPTGCAGSGGVGTCNVPAGGAGACQHGFNSCGSPPSCSNTGTNNPTTLPCDCGDPAGAC